MLALPMKFVRLSQIGRNPLKYPSLWILGAIKYHSTYIFNTFYHLLQVTVLDKIAGSKMLLATSFGKYFFLQKFFHLFLSGSILRANSQHFLSSFSFMFSLKQRLVAGVSAVFPEACHSLSCPHFMINSVSQFIVWCFNHYTKLTLICVCTLYLIRIIVCKDLYKQGLVCYIMYIYKI